MAKIANVATTDTFGTWRIRSNQSFDRLSQFAINNSSFYANTLTANVAFASKGLAALQGRATVGTNLTVSGNTSTNKLTVTSSLTSSGNTTLGDAAADQINTTGTLAHTGRATISTNLTVSGNTTLSGANVNITGTGKTLVKTANVDVRGGTFLVTSNTVIQATVDVANTFVSRKGAPIKGYGGNVVTLAIGDNGYYLLMANSGGMTLKIPSNASVPFPIGAEIVLVRTGANNHVAITNAAASVTIQSDSGKKRIAQQYQAAVLKKVGVNTWHLVGNLST